MRSDIIATICVTLCVFAICAATLVGCQMSNRQYYEALNNCTSHGGTWIPGTSGAFSGLCINARSN